MDRNTSGSVEVSVVMSCYNGEEWIRESIQSVIDQTYTNFEFIIVDDGSTDRSLDIMNEFARQDERITVIAKENTGLTHSLNIGLNESKGEWIARIDSDDICEPFRFERQILRAKANPDFVFVGSGFYIIDETGKTVKEYQCPANHKELQSNLYNAGFFPPHSSAFFRAGAAKEIGGYRVRIKRAQDWDLWLRLSNVGKLTAVDEPLVKIRKHSAQVSNEDAGKRQVTDCTIGTVSSLIALAGGTDPVESNEATFEKFRTWITKRLEDEQYFEFYEYLSQVRQMKAQQKSAITGMIKVCFSLLSRPVFLFRFARRKIIGDNMYQYFASQWLKANI